MASGLAGSGQSLNVITVTPLDLSRLTTASNYVKKIKGLLKPSIFKHIIIIFSVPIFLPEQYLFSSFILLSKK
jgi:hypothetical protein